MRVRAGLLAGLALSDQVFAQNEALPDADVGHFRQQAWLVALQASAEWPVGFAANLMLPSGRVATSSDTGSADDIGLGDVELRLRQDVTAIAGLHDPWARVNLTLGAVAPTGAYVSRKELVAAAGGLGQTMSLGRGAPWVVGEAEVTGRLGTRFGVLGAMYARKAIGDASDGFGWATEVRTALGVTVQLRPGLLAAALNVEHQWRGISTEVDFLNERVPAVNTGGRWLDAVPMLRFQVVDWLALTASARLPLWRQVEGVQAVQYLTVIAGVQGHWQQPRSPAVDKPGITERWPVQSLLRPGKVVVVGYWARWSALSATLSCELDALAADRPDVVIERVEVTDWTAAQLESRLGGAGSLPVVEVYDAAGQLLARLVGEDAFGLARCVPERR